jgi:hypothetical protein
VGDCRTRLFADIVDDRSTFSTGCGQIHNRQVDHVAVLILPSCNHAIAISAIVLPNFNAVIKDRKFASKKTSMQPEEEVILD